MPAHRSSRRRWAPGAPGLRCIAALAISLVVGCSQRSDAEYRAEVALAIHGAIGAELEALVRAARNLQAASPTRAWTPGDAAAIAEMRDAWRRARTAYEHSEGAIVALFPELDASLDGRYEDQLTAGETGGDGERDAFDARGFVGMHAIERVLFAPVIRPEVIAFERALPGYQPPAFPASDDEAVAFKTVLVQRLIDDADDLRKRWHPASVDIGATYHGLIGLMHEQRSKVERAATGQEESRYANITLVDLRNNVDGTRRVLDGFRDWILSRDAGEAPYAVVQRRLGELAAAYASAQGDALPVAPRDWSSAQPTDEHLATPFGALWKTVHDSVDPRTSGSVVFAMNEIAALLGLPELVAP
jgi:iron uptake system component EfeO